MADLWTRETVWQRYVEAFCTLSALPGLHRDVLRSAWPDIVRDFGDAIAAEEQRAFEAYPFPKGWEKPAPPSHAAVSRMEAVWSWHLRYLGTNEALAKVTIVTAMCRATGRPPIVKLCRVWRTPRTKLYKQRDQGLDTVRAGLIRDGVLADNFAPVLAA